MNANLEAGPAAETTVENARRRLKSVGRNVYRRSRKYSIQGIDWLEKHVAPKLPTWMLTTMKKMDSLLHYGFQQYQSFIKMPHMQKLIWATLLFAIGVSGFCVSFAQRFTMMTDPNFWDGLDDIHALHLRISPHTLLDILRLSTRVGAARISAKIGPVLVDADFILRHFGQHLYLQAIFKIDAGHLQLILGGKDTRRGKETPAQACQHLT